MGRAAERWLFQVDLAVGDLDALGVICLGRVPALTVSPGAVVLAAIASCTMTSWLVSGGSGASSSEMWLNSRCSILFRFAARWEVAHGDLQAGLVR